LASIAEAFARAEQLEDAQRAADIKYQGHRAEALRTIALELTRTGDSAPAAPVIATASTLGEWPIALPALPRLTVPANRTRKKWN
jgi:hypothetical protein